jgi:hypothetical protein
MIISLSSNNLNALTLPRPFYTRQPNRLWSLLDVGMTMLFRVVTPFGLLSPGDGDGVFLRNVGFCLRVCRASCPTRRSASWHISPASARSGSRLVTAQHGACLTGCWWHKRMGNVGMSFETQVGGTNTFILQELVCTVELSCCLAGWLSPESRSCKQTDASNWCDSNALMRSTHCTATSNGRTYSLASWYCCVSTMTLVYPGCCCWGNPPLPKLQASPPNWSAAVCWPHGANMWFWSCCCSVLPSVELLQELDEEL